MTNSPLPTPPDNLDKAAEASAIAGDLTNSVSNSGLLNAKTSATVTKIGMGFSFLSGFFSAFKSIFGKK